MPEVTIHLAADQLDPFRCAVLRWAANELEDAHELHAALEPPHPDDSVSTAERILSRCALASEALAELSWPGDNEQDDPEGRDYTALNPGWLEQVLARSDEWARQVLVDIELNALGTWDRTDDVDTIKHQCVATLRLCRDLRAQLARETVTA